MFTGIVRGYVPIQKIEKKEGLVTIYVLFDSGFLDNITLGSSIAVDGVCLTVTHVQDNLASFDIMEETLRVTTLGEKQEGDRINVERSARMGDEIGGHVVSGHVTTKGEVIHIHNVGHDVAMTLRVSPEWMKYVIHKGFIAVDGASLTVVEPEEDTFRIHLIPETLEKTSLGNKQVGDKVNIEIDPMTQAIVNTTERVLLQKQ